MQSNSCPVYVWIKPYIAKSQAFGTIFAAGVAAYGREVLAEAHLQHGRR